MGFRPRRILVTGVGMTKGLALARVFHEAGHDVVGADFEPCGALVCGRFSRSLQSFFRLPATDTTGGTQAYIDTLKSIVTRERIEIWVSCSGVVSAVDDGLAKEEIERISSCVAIQFDAATTQMLHEKDSFIAHVSSLGLLVPESHAIVSLDGALQILSQGPMKRKYIIKPIGVDDARRADMTTLPRASAEATVQHLKHLDISNKRPYILQQFIKGEEYCTQALIVQGKVRAFVACPSAELLMHYEALSPQSNLSVAMLNFTRSVAAAGGASFTGHLSFDFLVPSGQVTKPPEDILLYPIECNPRCHTAVILFANDAQTLSNEYTTMRNVDENKEAQGHVVHPTTMYKYYWSGHDLVTRLVMPLIHFAFGYSGFTQSMSQVSQLTQNILLSKDGTFEVWDPLPWWWLYHVYWPVRFGTSLVYSQKWSRINVSTTKMFCG